MEDNVCRVAPAASNEFVALVCELPITMDIVPRSKANVFEAGNSGIYKDFFPDPAGPADPAKRIRDVERRFYVDLAIKGADNVFRAKRKLTAIVNTWDGKPAPNREITWTVAHCTDLEFEVGGARSRQPQAVKTDSNGLAEITVVHRAAPPNSDMSPTSRAIFTASTHGAEATIELVVTRNSDVESLDQITRPSEFNLWVYEPDAANRSPSNKQMKDLQEAINEVVSRHRRVQNHGWVTLDGQFGDETRTALSKYLSTFTNVKGPDYPYDLSKIGIDTRLADYIDAEYGPFSIKNAQNKGGVIDRRLLIGEVKSNDTDKIDGLLELKEGVVDTLRSEMVRVANDYLNCNTFWLHRPIHNPYQQAADFVFRITAQVKVKTAPNPQAQDLGPSTQVGELFAVIPGQAAAGWVQINYPGVGAGWVRANSGQQFSNDQSIASNGGNLGGTGVAYSWGRKDLPARFSDKLNTNPRAPPADGGGNLLRIANWDEYQGGHKVGRVSNQNIDPEDAVDPPLWTGCDCSGFVQNCLTGAKFAAPDQRIIPDALTAAITINPNGWTQHEIGTGGFVGANAHAREVPKTTDVEHHFVRQGDVIFNPGHIVFVAEPIPNTAGNDFLVFNEYGSFEYYDQNGLKQQSPNEFLRKSLRMPFHYWGLANGLNTATLQVGKPYIWS
jgi:hypothetical protein